jgi:hypothetical protein
VLIWEVREVIWVWRRVCKGFEGEVVVLGAVDMDDWVVGGLLLLVFEIGGVVSGRVCAAVEGSCSGFVIVGSWTELGAVWTAGAGNGEEAGGEVDSDVKRTSVGSSRRSSKSEECLSSSSSCELGISPSGRIGRVGVREGGGMDIVRLGVC